MRKAGEIVGNTHKYLKQYIRPGVTTKELDNLANDFILKSGATPSFKNLYGFPGTICISINDEVVHGIPGKRKIKNGDVVSIDIGVCYKGYHSDSANTYIVGSSSKAIEDLVENTKKSLYIGLDAIKEGAKISDIGRNIENYAKKCNLSVVRELVGHGVGTSVHEDPDVPNYFTKTPLVLKAGMVLAVEPMLNLGERYIYMLDDDWTIKTDDELPSAHFEHTVLVTKDGYEILTGE